MKVSREQFAQNRERIVDAAGVLFREHGFDGVGIADIMQAAGLTHGGFYRHFASKDDLAAEAGREALAASMLRWKRVADASPHAPLTALLREYLSPRHRDAAGRGCVLAALGADAARHGDAVRGSVTDGVATMIGAIAQMLPDGPRAARRRTAITTLSAMIGALILSRAVDDDALSREILAAVTHALEPQSG